MDNTGWNRRSPTPLFTKQDIDMSMTELLVKARDFMRNASSLIREAASKVPNRPHNDEPYNELQMIAEDLDNNATDLGEIDNRCNR